MTERRSPRPYRALRAVGALVLLLGSVLAVPALLVGMVGWPLPRHLPSLGEVGQFLTSAADDQAIFRILACVIWVLWSIWVGSLVLAAYELIRYAGVTRPAPTGIQAVAAALLTAATLNLLGAASYAQQPAEAVTRPPTANVEVLTHPATTMPSSTDMLRGRTSETRVPRCVVGQNDTLWDLAAEFLGDPERWTEIYDLNRGLVQADGRSLDEPDLLVPGWVLVLPTPSEAAPRPSVPDPLPGSPQAPDPAPSVAPSESPSTEARGQSTRVPVPSPEAASAASAPADTKAGPGIELPGGWITVGFAAALSAAGALVWLRRRHRYQPEPLPGPDPEAADLRGLPPVIGAVRLQAREIAPVPPEADPTAGDQLPGPDGPTLAGAPTLIDPGGCGLTGYGAQSAARALLVATLSAGGPDDPDAAGTVLVPASTLADLLGPAAVTLGDLPRLTVAGGLPDALTTLENLLIARRRQLDEHDVPDLETLEATDPYRPPMPLMLLIADAPAPGLQPRVQAALQLGAPLRISAVFLGEWGPGTTLDVRVDGTIRRAGLTRDEAPERLSTLAAPTAVALLEVLREAHTGAPPSEATEPTSPATARIPPPDPAPTEAPDDPQLAQIRTLGGPPTILTPDGTAIPGIRRASIELLGLLVAHRAGLDLPDIMEIFYPDATVRRASERLSTTVSQLRQRIRTAVGQPDSRELKPVLNTGSHYQLNPDLVAVDWWTMQDALASTRGSASADRRAALERAVAAWTGPLFDGCDYLWAEPHREYSRRQAITAHTALAALLADDDAPRAAELLDAACAVDPLNEETARLAMRAHARAGNADAVRARLRRLRAALEEIDVTPDDETLAIADELLAR